jgi:hypothetical protein
MKMDKMTDEQIRVEIAKALGWKFSRIGERSMRAWAWEPGESGMDDQYPMIEGNEIKWCGCPNWPGEIGAAWALEESIPELYRGAYIRELCKVLGFDNFQPILWDLTHATPRQRCEAYLAWKGAEG